MVTLRKPKRSRAIIYLFECESKPYFLPPYVSVFASLHTLFSLAKKQKTKQQQETTDKQTK